MSFLIVLCNSILIWWKNNEVLLFCSVFVYYLRIHVTQCIAWMKSSNFYKSEVFWNSIRVLYYSRRMYNDRHIIFYKGMYVLVVIILFYYNILVVLEKIVLVEWNFVTHDRNSSIKLVLHVLTIILSRFVEVMYIYTSIV